MALLPRWLRRAVPARRQTVGEAMGIPRVRSFDSATRRRDNSDWVDSRVDANKEIYDGLSIIRSASREAERNQGLYRRMLGMHEQYIVGRGYEYQSTPRNPYTMPPGQERLAGQPDKVASDIIERRFRSWAKGRVTLDGRFTLRGLLKLAVRSWARDGELFFRKVVDRQRGLQLQPLEPDYVPETLHLPDQGLLNGIQTDKSTGRRTGYHFAKRHPGANGWAGSFFLTRPDDTQVVPAEEIIHLFKPERAGQMRGLPFGTAGFNDLRQLKGYLKAELAAARMNAARPTVVTQAMDADGQWTGDSNPDDEELEINLGESGVSIMPPGFKMEQLEAEHPSGTFGPYTQAVTRHLAAEWGVSHALLTRDLSAVNWSSLKIESIDVHGYFAGWQDELVETVLDQVFATWLETELLAGRMVSGKVTLPYRNFEKYKEGRFISPPFPSLDPIQALKESRERVRMNVSSLSEECLKLTGRELADVAAERSEERALLSGLGLLDIQEQEAPRLQKPNGAPPEEEEEEVAEPEKGEK